ncbi:MAG TPA: hypothetical protein VFR81_23850 [Longimicrobium sp.]|nr:hypothetical protein [Longimicrobium sp.]
MNVLAWCPVPDQALRWESIVEAEQVAHERIENQAEPGNRSFSIEVSELLDNGDQLLARTAAQVVPSGDWILSAAERAALGFSPDFRPTAGRLGIRPAHARAVVDRPDRITHHAASAATFYIRRVAGVRPERHLLVIVDGMAARPQIVAAWPIPVSVAGESPSPVAALHALCIAAGHPMVLRGDRMPVVLGERHPEIPADPTEVVWVEDGRIGVLQVRIGRDPETGEMLIGWAYSIDDDRLMVLLRP